MAKVSDSGLGGNAGFRVIIVGGSIAGLTLSHCLNRAGIDNIVLESRGDLAPKVGGPIGIFPNGARVLDQLGIYSGVLNAMEPCDYVRFGFEDGYGVTLDIPIDVHKRFGYPMAFLSRHSLLDALRVPFKDTSHIHVNKKVIDIATVEGGVHVFTQDGSVYTGDLVVGADGVHSKVRSEMWRIAHAAITPREKSSMKMRFASIFGVSSPVPGLTLGEQIVHCSDGLTIFLGVCRDYRVQYFITIDQGHTFTTPNIPRYTDDDARAASDRIKDTQILPGVRWGDIWSRRETFAMVALEETLFETWNFDRLVCIGDSMIKMTPNAGQGANSAIESAAELSNGLHSLLAGTLGRKPSRLQLETMLQSFTDNRRRRLNTVYKGAYQLCRAQSGEGLLGFFGLRHIALRFDHYLVRLPMFKTYARAPALDFVPLPECAGDGWSEYGQRKSRWSLHLRVLLSFLSSMFAAFVVSTVFLS